MRIAALVFLGAAIAWAQESTTGTISGSVIDAASKSPVGKAQVMLQPMFAPRNVATPPPRGFAGSSNMASRSPMRPKTVATGASGEFVFPNIEAGRYQVMVMHPRYPMPVSGPPRKEIDVKAGATASGISVELTPGAAVSGRVTDEDGDPLVGCFVQTPMSDGQMRGGPSMGSEASNENGDYRVWGLAPGKYYLVVQCMRPIVQPRPLSPIGPTAPPTVGYPKQFYPLASDMKSAQIVELTPGNEKTGVNFRLTPARVYTVNGTVSSPAGSLQQTPVNLTLVPREQGQRFMGGGGFGARIDQRTGAFQLQNVFPGSYYLVASAGNPGGVVFGARQAVEVSDRPVQVNVALEKPLELTGAIEVEGEQMPSMNGATLQLFPGDAMMGGPNQPMVAVQGDGSFVVKNVLPGTWRVMAFHPNAFLKAVQAGGRDLPNNVLDTSSGAPGPLRVILSTKTATVRGTGPPGKSVTLVEASSGSGGIVFTRPYSAMVAPSGEFTLSGLPPGKYRVSVGMMIPQPMADDSSQEIEVAEGSTSTIVVRDTTDK